MYEWINPTDPNLTPDAEVIVWNLPPSALFPIGALEFEFDNWCSANDGGVGTAPSPSAVPSFYFNGNHFTYYLTCADFNGYDLLISPTGVLLGYVDLNNNTYATNTVAGWQVGYNTTTRLALSTNTAPAGTCVIFKANVSELPGAPQPVGLVTFFNGTTALATEKMDAVGSASFATADLAPGTYSIQASFHRQDTHDASYAGSSVSAHQSLKVTSPSKSVPCN